MIRASSEKADMIAHDGRDPALRRRSGLWLQMVFLFTFGGLIVAGVLALSLIRQRQSALEEDEPGELVVEQGELASSTDERWVDATKVTLRDQGIKVKVKQVHWSTVRTRGADRRVATGDERRYLTIVVGLRNKADKPRQYRSWYGGLFQVAGERRTAELFDSAGNAYPIKKFPGATAVQGHVPEALLERPGETLDALVFAIPDDEARQSIDSLFLELPGQAFGADSLLRFEIPTTMIEGW